MYLGGIAAVRSADGRKLFGWLTKYFELFTQSRWRVTAIFLIDPFLRMVFLSGESGLDVEKVDRVGLVDRALDCGGRLRLGCRDVQRVVCDPSRVGKSTTRLSGTLPTFKFINKSIMKLKIGYPEDPSMDGGG